nr:hypothetical protein Hi04_10k_c2089_00010 [uncultured bacterium]
MNLKLAAIADSANASELGKLNILGIFREIFTSATPITYPFFHTAYIVEPSLDERDREHTMVLSVLDGDRRVVAGPVHGRFQTTSAPAGTNVICNLVIGWQGIVFPSYGDYVIELKINDIWMADLDLTVIPRLTTG